MSGRWGEDHGRSERYRYYACWNRNRRGKTACEAQSVRADSLEKAVLDALLDAAEQQRSDTSATTARHARDPAAVAAELRKVEASIERWINAFEDARSMRTRSPTACET